MDEQLNPQPEISVSGNVSAFGIRELTYFGLQLVFNLFLWNSILVAGFNLGFSLAIAGMTGCTLWYLWRRNAGWYPLTVLGCCVLIALGFPATDNGFVKFIMLWVLVLCGNLAFCVLAGQNRRSPNGFASLLDSPRALFALGFGGMADAFRGLGEARKNLGSAGRKGGAVAVGLLVSVPILSVMISLLTSADAAFEGLLKLLPEAEFSHLPQTLLFGGMSFVLLFSRGTALRHSGPAPAPIKSRRGVNSLTVHTVLGGVCLVYIVYLFSQLAYLSGGLAGILPKEFTMAEYARRGFFEMSWLCAINLTVISVSVGTVEKAGKTPLLTRIMCLFISVVTVFLVVTASAKMFMYIGSYGLTCLRVITEVIMLFLGLSTVIVAVWLFEPEMAYMKIIVLLALVMGGVTLWADVDGIVAAYNVRAYQSGRLETVDIDHLGSLGYGAVPYLEELTRDEDEEVARKAAEKLGAPWWDIEEDLQGWNYPRAKAVEILKQYREE